MLEIKTIQDYYELSPHHQSAILKELKTKIRLEDWLRLQNEKRKRKRRLMVSSNIFLKRPEYVIEREDIVAKPRDGSDIHPSQIHKCVKKIWMDCSFIEMDVPVFQRDDSDGLVYDSNKEPVVVGTEKAMVPYYLLGEEYIDPRLQMIFDMGHAWHDKMQGYGARGAWGPKKNYRDEVAIDPDEKDEQGNIVNPRAEQYWIKGAVDGVLDPYLINVSGLGKVAIRVLHEYKTINSNGYKNLSKPKSDHMWQATIYSMALDVPIVVYVYTNKDNCQLADFPVPFDRNLWAKIEAKIRKVQHYVEGHIVPPWEETSAVLSPRECMECPYVKLCQPPQSAVKKLTAQARRR